MTAARSSGFRILDGLLLAAAALGGILLLVPPSHPAPEHRIADKPPAASMPDTESDAVIDPGGLPPVLPEIAFMQTADGVDVATLEAEALQRWCLLNGLPAPPVLHRVEPDVARTLRRALQVAGYDRSARNLGQLGMIHASLGCMGSARTYFERAVAQEPKEFRWVYYLGVLQQTLGEYDAAQATFKRARALNGGYAMTVARLAEIHLWAGRLDEAADLFREYETRVPADSLGQVGLARIALRRQDYTAARSAAEQALRLEPGDFQAAYCLASALSGLGDHARARAVFDVRAGLPQAGRLNARDPLHAELRASSNSTVVLVEFLERLDAGTDYERMARLAEEIASRRPGDIPMLTNLASYYRKLQRFDAAHGALQRAVAIEADNILVLQTTAEVLLAERRFEEAAEQARRVLAIETRSARAHSILGRAHFMLQDYAAAAEHMGACVGLDPGDAGNRFVFAEALLALERLDEAEAEYTNVLRMAPSMRKARQRLTEISERRSSPQPP